MEWGDFRALRPVGLDADSMDSLLSDRREQPVQVMLLAGGGHTSLNPAAWIKRWQPRLALLNIEAGIEEGLPHPKTLADLDEISCCSWIA